MLSIASISLLQLLQKFPLSTKLIDFSNRLKSFLVLKIAQFQRARAQKIVLFQRECGRLLKEVL